jgi:hypothetical protein
LSVPGRARSRTRRFSGTGSVNCSKFSGGSNARAFSTIRWYRDPAASMLKTKSLAW